MKILFVSSFEAWSLGVSYLKAFHKSCYDPLCFDVAREYESSSWLTKNRYANRLICNYLIKKINEKIICEATRYKPDLIFIHKGGYIYPQTLKNIRTNTNCLLFNFNPDDPFNTISGASNELIRNSISEYDCYFIWSKSLVSKLKHAGARKVEYLPFASDPELHYPVSVSDEDRIKYGVDISFVGNWDVEREKWLSALEEYNLAIWGTDYWKTRCRNKLLRSSWKGGIVIGDEMSKVIQLSKISLNILRLQNKGSHNMRTFEIPTCGGFILHERSEEVLGFFSEGEEIACFSSPVELKEKIDYYLPRHELRMAMASKAFQKVKTYTYLERTKKILQIYTKMRGDR